MRRPFPTRALAQPTQTTASCATGDGACRQARRRPPRGVRPRRHRAAPPAARRGPAPDVGRIHGRRRLRRSHVRGAEQHRQLVALWHWLFPHARAWRRRPRARGARCARASACATAIALSPGGRSCATPARVAASSVPGGFLTLGRVLSLRARALAAGSVHKYTLAAGERRSVDNGHLLAWSASMPYETGMATRSMYHSVATGEGLMCHFMGPGTLYLQSHKSDEGGGGDGGSSTNRRRPARPATGAERAFGLCFVCVFLSIFVSVFGFAAYQFIMEGGEYTVNGQPRHFEGYASKKSGARARARQPWRWLQRWRQQGQPAAAARVSVRRAPRGTALGVLRGGASERLWWSGCMHALPRESLRLCSHATSTMLSYCPSARYDAHVRVPWPDDSAAPWLARPLAF